MILYSALGKKEKTYEDTLRTTELDYIWKNGLRRYRYSG